MVARTANPEEMQSLEEKSLLELSEKGLLSPEWSELAVLMQRSPRQDNQDYSYEDIYRGLPMYALAATEAANKFRDNTFDLTDTTGEILPRQINRGVLLYYNLGGVHGIAGREQGFINLIEAFDVLEASGHYSDIKLLGTRNRLKSFRLRANMLEELGTYLNDRELLARSMLMNDELSESKDTALDPLKIHSLFSRHDIAWHYIDNPEMLMALMLPTTPQEIMADNYEKLAQICKEISLDENPDVAETNTGAIVEHLVLNALRNRIIYDGEEANIDIGLSFLHEDYNTNLLDYRVKGALGDRDANNPNSSFDIKIIDKETGTKVKVDVKKGKVYGAGDPLGPDCIRITPGHSKLDDKGFVEQVGLYSEAMQQIYSGQAIDYGQALLIGQVEGRLDLPASIDTYKQRAGYDELGALGRLTYQPLIARSLRNS